MIDKCFIFRGEEIFDVSIGRNGNLGKVYLIVGPFQALTVLSGWQSTETLFVGEFDGHIIVAAKMDEDFLFLADET